MVEQGYQVIARRWRPQQFDELVGQDHITQALGNAIKMNRIGHAYLFVGPRGTGKTTSARLFAKSLNWEKGPSLRTDDDSEIGKAIMEGRCLDVIEIDAASNNGVEQVRELCEECRYAPAQCRFKIYVIDEVHMLSQAAFNALLKTLEEPPQHVKFIFATTESRKVLPTITSRCQRFEFRPISADQIAGKLKEICQSEGIEAEPEALASIARLANGGMRDAQSILDQMISFCEKEVTQPDVLTVYGLASPHQIEELAKGIAKADYNLVLGTSSELSEAGLDLHRSLVELQDVFRESLVAQIRSEENVDDHGFDLTVEEFSRILDVLQEGESRVKRGLSDRVNFEAVLFKALEAGRSRAIDGLIREIGSLAAAAGAKKKIVETSETSESEDENEITDSPAAETESLPEQVEQTVEEVEPDPEHGGSVTESTSQESAEVASGDEATSQEPEGVASEEEPRSVDEEREELEKSVDELPASTRKILEEEYQVTFLGVEDIDENKLD